MLKISLVRLSLIAVLLGTAALPLRGQTPEESVRLQLEVDRRIAESDRVSWVDLPGRCTEASCRVQPGDTLRYTVTGINDSDRAIANFVITQPLDPQTSYILDSLSATPAAQLSYSIDGGRTFSANPTIEVAEANGRVERRPAPAERYTHVRVRFREPIAARGQAIAQFQVRVK
ncbi:DUF11 domain-containing protein [Oxynema aestuarii]|uniref:DUF11 domain-containing protein n=1 Tax=Oxynema aestuarii AP17 TaxID=2064643 RepID=A0A6H1TV41_9CYAN|nr:DUF11 domain-containing protein [Oxynema aestuarii]QIZ70484.1 DUF11 domain-containing protein [Oxynema aestuarii AP17]